MTGQSATPATVASLVKTGERLLRPSSSSRLDAEILLGHVTGCDRANIYRDPDAPVTSKQQEHFAQLTSARALGQPVAQLVGHVDFWSLSFKIDPNVLIPRPETELLVELALSLIPNDRDSVLADLGTGSGAIATVVALERPHATIVATDLSSPALQIARRNFIRHSASRIFLLRADWLVGFGDAQFDLIVANPPYVSADDPKLSNSDIRFEPVQALTAGRDGIDDLCVIVKQAPRCLKSGGYLVVEHGYTQGSDVRCLFAEQGFQRINTQHDLAGMERVTCGRMQIP